MTMHFEPLRGRKSLALRDRFDEPLVVTLKTQETYGGLVDECYYNGGWLVALYSCKLLEESSLKWIDHDVFTGKGGRRIRDPIPEFWIGEVEQMEVLSEDLRNEVDLDDALQLYIDPHYKPLPHVRCNWNRSYPNRSHNADCEFRLHEALSSLYTQSEENISSSKEDPKVIQTNIDKWFALIRRRLLVTGARIP